MSNQCTNCSAVGCPLSLCSRCKVAKYCTRECQLQHWNLWHKKECRTVEADSGLTATRTSPSKKGT